MRARSWLSKPSFNSAIWSAVAKSSSRRNAANVSHCCVGKQVQEESVVVSSSRGGAGIRQSWDEGGTGIKRKLGRFGDGAGIKWKLCSFVEWGWDQMDMEQDMGQRSIGNGAVLNVGQGSNG